MTWVSFFTEAQCHVEDLALAGTKMSTQQANSALGKIHSHCAWTLAMVMLEGARFAWNVNKAIQGP